MEIYEFCKSCFPELIQVYFKDGQVFMVQMNEEKIVEEKAVTHEFLQQYMGEDSCSRCGCFRDSKNLFISNANA